MNHTGLTNIGAAILAGGQSTRYFGKNKALLKIIDQTILERNIITLGPIFKEIHLISNHSTDFEQYKLPVFKDRYNNIGPLGGIFTALFHSNSKAIFVFSCDMPFLSSDLINDILVFFTGNNFDIVIPQINDKIEPMHSIYSKNILPLLEEHIKHTDNYKIRQFFNKVSTSYLQIENTTVNQKAFLNVNSPKDLQIAHNLK